MDKKSKSKLSDIVPPLRQEYPSKCWDILTEFFNCTEYIVRKKNLDFEKYRRVSITFAEVILKNLKSPPIFECFHRALRSPIDYYQLGLDLFAPMIDFSRSTLTGIENIQKIQNQLEQGENVILLANHQIEADPQVLSLFLQDRFPRLAEEIIFVAGERVTTDPLAIPNSLGRNLFCIYSKKYFDVHSDRKAQMIEHNTKTLAVITKELKEGGKFIFVAPSGGRDRPDASGIVKVSPFDPQSVELFYLLGKKAGRTHFYPLALSTHDILPPPAALQIDLGETRHTDEAPVHIAFGSEIDMENLPTSTDKNERKTLRASYIESLVRSLYNQFPQD